MLKLLVTPFLILFIFSQTLVFGAENGASFYERMQEANSEDLQEMVRELIANPAEQRRVLHDASPEERQVIMGALLEVSRAQDRQRTEEWLALPEEERRKRLEESQKSREKADEIEARFRAAVARHQEASGSDEKILSSDGEAASHDLADLGPDPEDYIDRWRFRSVMNLAGEFLFSLHNPWDEMEMWIGLDQEISNIRATGFDTDMRALEIESEGMTRTIFLTGRESKGMRVSEDARDPDSEPAQEINEFRERWLAAVHESAELRDIERRFNELATEFRRVAESRSALIASEEPISGEELRSRSRLLVTEMQMIRREAYHLTETLVQQLREHEDFRDLNLEIRPELTRFMMSGRRETER